MIAMDTASPTTHAIVHASGLLTRDSKSIILQQIKESVMHLVKISTRRLEQNKEN